MDFTVGRGSTVGRRLDFEAALCQQVSSWPLPKPSLHLSRPKASPLCAYLHTLVRACTQARFRISRPSHAAEHVGLPLLGLRAAADGIRPPHQSWWFLGSAVPRASPQHWHVADGQQLPAE